VIANELVRDPVDLICYSPWEHMGRASAKFALVVPPASLLQHDTTLLKRAGTYTVRCQWPSAPSHLWASVHASDHPYVFGPTTLDGRFRLDGVPPGTYQLVCWHGPFTVERQEQKEGPPFYAFGGPLEMTQEVVVAPKGKATTDFTLNPVR
jgi:hypothetical protein